MKEITLPMFVEAIGQGDAMALFRTMENRMSTQQFHPR